MWSLTNEWQQDAGENFTKYMLYIDNFDKKIKTFSTGTEISSKVFKIGNSSFQVVIFPCGEHSHDSSHVSLSLKKKSSWRVRVRSKVSVLNKDIVRKLADENMPRLDTENTWSIPRFIPHNRCTRNDLLSNGVLAVEVSVEILEEEGPDSAEVASVNTAEKFARLESTMHAQTGLISHLQQCLDNLETRTQAQSRDIQFLVRQVNMPGKVTVECPVCLEVCVPGMRLRQCGQGHILCDSCHTMAGQVAATGVGLCPTCREEITGRPTQLERVLGLI